MKDAIVSFGLNIKRPNVLEHRRTSEILDDIKRGRWQEQVSEVRKHPYRSDAQRAAKLKLPYVLGSGEFASRSNDGLIRHSGQVWIDVDNLTPKQCLRVLSRAVLDHYCLAAFHSASGHGVRLTFRVQPEPSDPATHKTAFRQVAAHVAQFYSVEPDSGSDVARASFVSHDKTMVINLSAKALPVVLKVEQRQPVLPACRAQRFVSVAESIQEKPHTFKDLGVFNLGLRYAPSRLKPDGSLFTHLSLRQLGTRLASYILKEGFSSEQSSELLDEAFRGWSKGAQHNLLNHSCSLYRQELGSIVRCFLKKPGDAAAKWTRWLQDAEYPAHDEPCFKLLFVIRRHCKEAGKKTFYLSCRDAAKVASVKSSKTSAKLLKNLIRCGYLSTANVRGYAMKRFDWRKAQTYRLLS